MASSTKQKTCNTEEFQLMKFVFSSDSGRYSLIGEASEEELQGSHLRRSLLDTSFSRALNFQDDGSVSPIFASNQIDERLLGENDHVVYGRRCVCAKTSDAYCPVGAELCRIVRPNPFTYRVQCDGEVQGMVGRFLLPLILFMFCMFTCLLLTSPKGKYAQGHIRKLLCCWQEDRYEHELRQEIDRMAHRNHRRRMRARAAVYNARRVYFNQSAEMLSPYIPQEPSPDRLTSSDVQVAKRVAVGLKTRRYKSQNDESMNECTICLSDFAEGDRVGNLICGHIFHVEPCLKQWIVRRNHCPLCKSNNLAVPRDPKDDAEENSTQPRTLDEAGTRSTNDNATEDSNRPDEVAV